MPLFAGAPGLGSPYPPNSARAGRSSPPPALSGLLLVLLAEVFELGVHHIALLATGLAGGAAGWLGFGLRLPVHDFGQLVRGLLQSFLGPLDPIHVVALERLPHLAERRLNG